MLAGSGTLSNIAWIRCFSNIVSITRLSPTLMGAAFKGGVRSAVYGSSGSTSRMGSMNGQASVRKGEAGSPAPFTRLHAGLYCHA